MTHRFGPTWDAPITQDTIEVPTPVGQSCSHCHQAIIEGDRGWLRVFVESADSYSVRPIHAECEMIQIMGHVVGVCRHTGWDGNSREAAKECWRRVWDLRGGAWRL